ncbi:MAG: hypothetical protein MH252_00345 [Thermosynechococcaceae cyanobacterium MS004]|nr:hypothetical protein [Thermosynechococcaceae cyanobacterium MS004]
MNKFILTILTVAALGTTLSAPLIANAREFRLAEADHAIGFRNLTSNSYQVLFRRNHRQAWQFYAYYGNRFQAEKAAFRLRRDGYRAYVERAKPI